MIKRYASFYVACLAILHTFYGFLNFRNDFPGILYFSDRIDFSSPGSLYNGFYPFAYPLLLRLIPDSLDQPLALLLNLASAWILLTSASRILKAYLPERTILISIVLVSVSPWFHAYIFSAGPDPLAAAFFILGLEMLFTKKLLKAGLFIGLAALFRQHYIVLGVLSLLLTIPGRKSIRPLLPFLALVSFQFLINAAATGNPFSSSQSFNLHKIFNMPDWSGESGQTWIRPYPIQQLVRAYSYVLPFLVIMIPGLIHSEKRIKRLFLAFLIYLILFIPFRSESIWLPVGVFIYAFFIERTEAFIRSFNLNLKLIGLPLIALSFLYLLMSSFSIQQSVLSRIPVQEAIDRHTDSDDLIYTMYGGITDADNVPVRYIHGGWARLTDSAYNARYPQLPLHNPSYEIHEQCGKLGIDIILMEGAVLDTSHFTLLYAGDFMRRRGGRVGLNLYRVKERPTLP